MHFTVSDLRVKHRLESELLATTLPSPQIHTVHASPTELHKTSGKERLAATPLSRGDGKL